MVMISRKKLLGRRLPGFLAVALWLAIFTGSWVSGAEVVAELDRDSVPAGNGSVLTLRVSGARAAQPVIPEVENLIVNPRGQSHEMRMVNGRTTVSVTYNYVVGSNVPGDYEIPAIRVVVDGAELLTEPLKLKVLDAGAAQPPAGMPPQAPGAGEDESTTDEGDEKRFGFLTVELAANNRKHAYVGEIAPVRIRAWLPENSRAQLRSGIKPESKAFTLHNVNDRPQQSTEIRDGKRYTVVTWYGGMSATKAGKHPASLSLDAVVAVRDASAPRRRRGGPFDDPFFDHIFDDIHAPMIQKEVTLKSDDQEIEVRSLPTDGRPDGFSGAVGNFQFDRVEVPDEWVTGEPRQIGARIAGSGNFALMNAPEMVPEDVWKSYPGKGDFAPGDEASFSGSKTFRFNAMPRRGGEQEVSLEFSYFNPDKAEYQTLTSPRQKIQVTGADLAEDAPETAPVATEPEKPTGLPIGQHLQWTNPGPLVPLVSRSGFVPLLGTAALMAALGGVLAWWRARRNDPRRIAAAEVERISCEALRSAKQCAATGDATGFFAAARLAIQQRLGMRWNQAARAITLAEIEARLPGDSPVAAFFREADHHAYHPTPGGQVLPRWQKLLDEAFQDLNKEAH
ncbi:MAG: protein BatD [Verrucomicrobiaceae bacterium]|nr:MAG: protein BatD [Verrucomicrobiaceae bacterium]